MQTPTRDEVIRDGLRFKADLENPSSGLASVLTELYRLREQNIQMAKRAHSRKNEERACYFMGVVDGLDQAIILPKKMFEKWERTIGEEAELVGNNGTRR